MPALISYVVARTGESEPKNVVAYELPAVYVTPLPARNNNVKAWASADESMGGGTGTFPAEGDVKLGIDYGPTGAEYEGTYAPVTGGNTYSRSRVTNA